MNDQAINEGLWSWQMIQLTAWMEWLLPLLYCLMALVLVSLLLTLIDLALLCWEEFHPSKPQKATPIPTAASAALTESATAISQPILLVTMLLFGVASALAQEHSSSLNAAIRDSDLQQRSVDFSSGNKLGGDGADFDDRLASQC